MRTLIAVLFVLIVSVANSKDQALIDAATEYVDNPVQVKVMDEMFSPETIFAQFGPHMQQLTKQQKDKIVEIILSELNKMRGFLRTAMIDSTAEIYNLEEISALKDFSSTKIGSSAMAKLTPYFSSAMSKIAPVSEQMIRNIQNRIKNEVPK
ncbi:MAG: hypothetical protein AAF217_08760 [Pseudomonadota bacterium]